MASVKKKPAAKKSSAPKVSVKKKPAAKAAKKPTVKAATKKTVAKKTVVKKEVVKKTAAKKPVVKKLVAKPAAKKPVVKAVARTAAKPAVKPPLSAAPKGPQGLPEQLRDTVLKILDERQADEIVCVPLIGRSSVADYMIIASGRASRQVTAIADHLRRAFFELGVRQLRIEGQSEGNWVLVDAGDVIVHLFRPEVRSYYDLDAIWAAKPAARPAD